MNDSVVGVDVLGDPFRTALALRDGRSKPLPYGDRRGYTPHPIKNPCREMESGGSPCGKLPQNGCFCPWTVVIWWKNACPPPYIVVYFLFFQKEKPKVFHNMCKTVWKTFLFFMRI